MSIMRRGGIAILTTRAALCGLALSLAAAGPALADGPERHRGGHHGGKKVIVTHPGHHKPRYNPHHGRTTVIVKQPYYYHHRRPVYYSSHRHHHSNAGKGVAIAAGVLAGAVLLDAIIDDNRQPAQPAYRDYGYIGAQPVRYPAAPPQPAPTPYYENNTSAVNAAAAPGTYDRAYADCAARARVIASEKGAYRSFVSNVTGVSQAPDGAWTINGFLSTDRANGSFARQFNCTADAGGVRTLQLN